MNGWKFERITKKYTECPICKNKNMERELIDETIIIKCTNCNWNIKINDLSK